MGAAVLLSLHTEREIYANPTAPVNVEAIIFAPCLTAARLIWQAGGEQGEQPLDLVTGTQRVTFTLPVSLRPGVQELQAALVAEGLTHTRRVSFTYGTDAPDLSVSAPSVMAWEVGLTRTVRVRVRNQGGYPSDATTVQLWEGGWETGSLITEEALPALGVGEAHIVELPWPIAGLGVNRRLVAVVDPGDRVAEWAEDNNLATAEVRLQPVAVALDVRHETWMVGTPLSVTLRMVHLEPGRSPSLVVTATLERPGWLQVVERITRTVELEREETLAWIWETAGLQGGSYTVQVQVAGENIDLVTKVSFWLYSLADFEAEPRRGPAPLEVRFRDRSVAPEPVRAWAWDFGDGSPVVTDTNPVHIYTTPGVYTVTLTTTVGLSTSVSVRPAYITVLEPELHRLYLPLVMRNGGKP